MTTQNVRKKIPHALHFKLTLLINYFTSYIKKCQTGTYIFWLSVYPSFVTFLPLSSRFCHLCFDHSLPSCPSRTAQT